MGEHADYMLNGDDCQVCGEYLGDGDGFPRCCAGCADEGDSPVPSLPNLQRRQKAKSARNKRRRKRLAEKNRQRLKAFDPAGWAQLSVSHFRRVIDGKNLDHWPSTGKWMFEGIVRKEGLDEFLKKQVT